MKTKRIVGGIIKNHQKNQKLKSEIFRVLKCMLKCRIDRASEKENLGGRDDPSLRK